MAMAAQRGYEGISIHALLAESDHGCNVGTARRAVFLSTLSLRRATPAYLMGWESENISIHALLAESDTVLPGGLNRA